jgi:betaine reductase
LGLEVHHVLEPEVRSEVPADVFDEQVGIMADVLDGTALADAVARVRAGLGGG